MKGITRDQRARPVRWTDSLRTFANPNRRGVVGVARSGGMAERFNAPVLKTAIRPLEKVDP